MEFRFCPKCRSRLTLKLKANGKIENQPCSKCNFIYYPNPKACVGAVIVEKDKVLLIQRANEPFKDHWDFPGGFLENGERTEEGLEREIGEELRVGVKISHVLGIYKDTYGPGGEETLNIYYLCEIRQGQITPQTEIADVKWFDVNKLPSNLAFGHVRNVLMDWHDKYYSISN